jgi:hypothetical protein
MSYIVKNEYDWENECPVEPTPPITPTTFEVRYVDYDGSLLSTQQVLSGADAVPPTNPNRTSENLVFQAWSDPGTAIDNDLDIGAVYITDDNKTHLHINLSLNSGLNVTVYLNKTDTSTLTVDWGDTTSSTFTNTGNFNTGAHTYSAYGNYIIKLWISWGKVWLISI